MKPTAIAIRTLLIAIFMLSVVEADAPPDSSALNADLCTATNRLTVLLSEPDSTLLPALDQLLHSWIDGEVLTQRAFGDYLHRALKDCGQVLSATALDQLVARHQRRVAAALHQRGVEDLAALLRQYSVRAIHVLAVRVHGDRGEVDLLVLAPGAQVDVRGQLWFQNGSWRFIDLVIDDERLSRRYRNRYREIIDKHQSPSVLIAALKQQPFVVLDDFSDTPTGELPLDWGAWREKDQNKPVLYRVETDGTAPYLAAVDSGQSVILGKFVHWDPRRYPILTWCWRAETLPVGADESKTELNDSAAGLYVIFSQNWLGVPKQLKYVWSSSLPVGTIGRRNMLFRPWFFVLESGTEKLGRWVFEQVDLEAHHRLKLGRHLPGHTIGLGILTDANSTRSLAKAGYADIRVWTREAQEGGLIENYCDCLGSAPLVRPPGE